MSTTAVIATISSVAPVERWSCGAAAIARAVRYAADRAGVEHVALGSDFDGATTTPFDTTGLDQITAALLDANFSDDEVRLIMGQNVVRLLRQTLPKGTPP